MLYVLPLLLVDFPGSRGIGRLWTAEKLIKFWKVGNTGRVSR